MRAKDRGSLPSLIRSSVLPTILSLQLCVPIWVIHAFKFIARCSGTPETAICVPWIHEVIGDLNFIFLLFFSELVHCSVIRLRCEFQTMLPLSFVSIKKSWMFIEISINLLDFWHFPLEIYFCTFFLSGIHVIFSLIGKLITHIIDFALNSIPCSNVMVVKFIAVEFLPSLSLSSYQRGISLPKCTMSTFITHQINEVIHG